MMMQMESVSDHFPATPPGRNLHIIVQPPTTPPALQSTAAKHRSDLLNVNTIPPSAPGNPVNKKDIDERRKTTELFVSNLKQKIKQFLINPHGPNWVPPQPANDETREFYDKLAIPTDYTDTRPCLLLHNVGKIPNPNADNLFRTEKHR
jgi:hypothetical protein